MKIRITRIRGIFYILWHSRHEFYHILIGLVWVWILREYWDERNIYYLYWGVFGSVFPDIDHFYYFIGYGKRDSYTQTIIQLIKKRQWRNLTVFIEKGHKQNTHLTFHNIYTIAFCLFVFVLSHVYNNKGILVFVGAVILHFFFDIIDDLLIMRRVNPNWFRWGSDSVRRDPTELQFIQS